MKHEYIIELKKEKLDYRKYCNIIRYLKSEITKNLQ